MKEMTSGLEEKVARNNQLKQQKHFKDWYFVVVDAGMKRDYEKYGKTLTRTEVKKKMTSSPA